jgi:hypothetical protein
VMTPGRGSGGRSNFEKRGVAIIKVNADAFRRMSGKFAQIGVPVTVLF